MRLFFVLASLCLSLCVIGCNTAEKSGDAQKPFKVLVFSKTSWYRHEAIPKLNEWFVELGKSGGFEADATEDAAAFTPENLARYRVVVFNNTTDVGKSLDDAQKRAFEDWYAKGGGYVGIHAAAVHHKTWPWYEKMLGNDFNSDTEHQLGRVVVDREADAHPAVTGWGTEQRVTEEWMNYESSVRGTKGTRVLLTLDESSLKDKTVKKYFQDKGGKFMGADHPVSWARKFGGGRVFYTNFGHDAEALQTELGRSHVLNGLLWAASIPRGAKH